MRAAWIAIVFTCACGGGGGGAPGPDADSAHPDGGPPGPTTLRDRQRQLAIDLRGVGNFMVGIGNDNTGPYDHAIPIDLHYAYLDGYGDGNGWPTWNTNGDYPKFFAATADQHAVGAAETGTVRQIGGGEARHHRGRIFDHGGTVHAERGKISWWQGNPPA